MKKLNKKKILAFTVIGVSYFLIVLLLEIFLFNFNYFYYGSKAQELTDVSFHNLEPIENGNYKILDDDAWIEINSINDYVNTLEFQTDYFGKNIYMEVEYNNKIDQNYINITSLKAIPINDTVEGIKIKFLDAEDQNIHLSNFYAMNSLEINIFRIGIMMLLFVLISIIIFVLVKKGNVRLEMIFLILILSFGSLNSIMTPVFHSLDEGEHFIKAYNLASGNIAMNKGDMIEYPKNFDQFLNRKFKSPNENFQDTYPKYKNYSDFINETKYLLKFNFIETELTYFHSTAITYTDWPYLASALGIFIGKIFNFPILISFYLGRLFNLLMYAIAVFFAIKLIPIGKKLLFACALVPTIVFLSGTYSADVMVNALTLLSFAVIIKWTIEQKKVKISQLILIVICFMLITASKATYMPFFLLILLLRNENFSSRKNEIYIKITVMIIAMLTFMGVFYYGTQMGLSQWPIEGVDSSKQILTILMHPIRYLIVLIQTFSGGIIYLLRAASVLVVYVGRLSESSFYLVWLMLLFTAVADIGPRSSLIEMRDRGIILLTCGATLVLSMTALYVAFTPVGASTIHGFQGRYIIPIIFPILFLLQRKKLIPSVNPDSLNSIVVLFSTCMLFYMSMYIFLAFY